jgi:hypothetical protein
MPNRSHLAPTLARAGTAPLATATRDASAAAVALFSFPGPLLSLAIVTASLEAAPLVVASLG